MAKNVSNTDDWVYDFADLGRVRAPNDFLIEQHQPAKFHIAYHHHTSVEVNFLTGCEMTYSFSGKQVCLPPERMTIFWGTIPHGVEDVVGKGDIVNIYITLSQILKWGLPTHFIEALINGNVLSAKKSNGTDTALFSSWASDFRRNDPAWQRLLLGEIEMRLRRMALEDCETLLPGAESSPLASRSAAGTRNVNNMLRYISNNYADKISVLDVAEHSNLSPSYAMSLFRRSVGMPIKGHITRIRFLHAEMLLATTDEKVLSIAMESGFGSLSSFYDAFSARSHQTPAAFRREIRN